MSLVTIPATETGEVYQDGYYYCNRCSFRTAITALLRFVYDDDFSSDIYVCATCAKPAERPLGWMPFEAPAPVATAEQLAASAALLARIEIDLEESVPSYNYR